MRGRARTFKEKSLCKGPEVTGCPSVEEVSRNWLKASAGAQGMGRGGGGVATKAWRTEGSGHAESCRTTLRICLP